MTAKAKSIQQVRKHIATKYPTVGLLNGGGYFYIFSDDEEMGLFLAGRQTTSIYVNSIREMSLEQWMESVDDIMNDGACYFSDTENK